MQPIIISILFHHYKELKECLSEVEQIRKEEAKVNERIKSLPEKEEEQGKIDQESPSIKQICLTDWID